jgi:hypothetical protein
MWRDDHRSGCERYGQTVARRALRVRTVWTPIPRRKLPGNGRQGVLRG